MPQGCRTGAGSQKPSDWSLVSLGACFRHAFHIAGAPPPRSLFGGTQTSELCLRPRSDLAVHSVLSMRVPTMSQGRFD